MFSGEMPQKYKFGDRMRFLASENE